MVLWLLPITNSYDIFVSLKTHEMSTKEKVKKETPLMQQYNQIKAKYPDACLLFRVGDFYETFGEDAVRTAKVLGITLTKRGAGSSSETELAGFPHHSLNVYLRSEERRVGKE